MPFFQPPKTQEYSVVDPVQSQLDKDVVKNGKFNQDLREKIIHLIDKIEKYFQLKINKVYAIGSSLTYQYTPNCDIDITLFVHANEDELKDLNKVLKEKFNAKIFEHKHPINFHFTSGKFSQFKADAIYDLGKNKWIKKPQALSETDVKEIIHSCQNVKEFTEILSEYNKLKKMLHHYRGDAESLDAIFQQTFKVNNLFEKIKEWRREEYDEKNIEGLPSANFRCSNIIFKLLEQYGLDNLSLQITKFIKSRAKF